MQPQEKAIYQDMLKCIFAKYLQGYSENLYAELLKKYNGPAAPEVGAATEASYETVLRLLKEKTGRYTGLGRYSPGNTVEGNVIYPAAFQTRSADPEQVKETDYGTAWDAFDNLLRQLPEEKQVECKMVLNTLDSILHDPGMTRRQKELLASIPLDWISHESEEVGIVFVPLLLQIYE